MMTVSEFVTVHPIIAKKMKIGDTERMVGWNGEPHDVTKISHCEFEIKAGDWYEYDAYGRILEP